MIWSPLQWSRPAWDLIFIVDFTLTAIFLCAAIARLGVRPSRKVKGRAVGMWLVFLPAHFSSPKLVKLSAHRFPVESFWAPCYFCRGLPPARTLRLGGEDPARHLEPRWSCRRH